MSKKIMIVTDEVQMEAELNERKTAALIWEALPIDAEVSTWGDEIYMEESSCRRHDQVGGSKEVTQ